MKKEIALVNKSYVLEKFQGKGGWTFIQVPEIKQSKHTPFGWVRIRGTIDGHEIKGFNLQSMGNGLLFLPIKAEIRKKIKKEAGDSIHLTLFEDNFPTDIPEEFKLCLLDEPNVYKIFLSYSDGKKKSIIDWIYSDKTDKTKVDRIAKIIQQISQNNN